MKKNAALLLIITLVGGLLAGCGGSKDSESVSSGSDSQGTESTQTETASEDGKTEITLWHALTNEEVDTFQSYVDQFNEQSETVHVTMIYTPADEYIKQLTIGNIAGDLADMVLLDNPYNVEFAATGVLEDLSSRYDEWEENQFLDGPLSSASYEGGIYGIPYSCNDLALFYNEDMLEEAGVEVPTTWEELREAALALTTDGRYGFALCGTKDAEGVFQLLPFINSAGGDINNLNTEGSIAALQLIGDMVSEGSISKEIMNWSQADVEKQFAAGNAAMMINGVWQVDTIYNDNPELNWNVSYIPVMEGGVNATGLGGENLCVTKGANIDASWEFISWMCGREINPKLCKDLSRFSARSDINNEDWFDDEIILFFANYMEDTYARVHPRWTECNTVLAEAYQKVVSGEADAASAMETAQAEIDQINAEE